MGGPLATDVAVPLLPEAEIDRMWSRGDRDALGWAHRRYRVGLEAVAFRILRDRSDAEDTVQRVFLSVQTATYRGTASTWTYLYRAAVNASLSMLRARRRRAALESEQLARIPARAEPVAEAQVLEGEMLAAVAKALLGVKPRHRQVLTLRIVHNLSNTEIAQQLGIPLPTVGTRLRRGREELRKNLKPFLRDL